MNNHLSSLGWNLFMPTTSASLCTTYPKHIKQMLSASGKKSNIRLFINDYFVRMVNRYKEIESFGDTSTFKDAHPIKRVMFIVSTHPFKTPPLSILRRMSRVLSFHLHLWESQSCIFVPLKWRMLPRESCFG